MTTPITWTEHPNDTAPRPPAAGENGRWERLGSVIVDGASLGITDPTGTRCEPSVSVDADARSEPWGTGVRFMSGFGDGTYDVWGWVVDYGGDAEERIAQVVMTLVDEEALTEWWDTP